MQRCNGAENAFENHPFKDEYLLPWVLPLIFTLRLAAFANVSLTIFDRNFLIYTRFFATLISETK